jgi:hypothetical protein
LRVTAARLLMLHGTAVIAAAQPAQLPYQAWTTYLARLPRPTLAPAPHAAYSPRLSMVSRHTLQPQAAQQHRWIQHHQTRQQHLACSRHLLRRHRRCQRPSGTSPSTKICLTPSALCRAINKDQQRSLTFLRRSLTSYEDLLHPLLSTKIWLYLAGCRGVLLSCSVSDADPHTHTPTAPGAPRATARPGAARPPTGHRARPD